MTAARHIRKKTPSANGLLPGKHICWLFTYPKDTPHEIVRSISVCTYGSVVVKKHSSDDAGASVSRTSGGKGTKAHTAGHIENDFLVLLSHELRTPLNGIMGMLQLAMHTRSRDSIQEYLTVALESSQHLLFLLSGVSEIFSGAKGHHAKSESFDPASVINPIISSFAAKAGSKGLALSCRIDSGLPERLVGDPGHIRQILCNLLTHAVRHAESGNISVLVERPAEDGPMQGNGLHVLIKADNAGTVQQPPQSSGKADAGVQYGDAGTGLELAIAERLAHMLNGEMTVSSPQGKFGEVQVTLPLQSRKQPAEQEKPAGRTGAAAPRQAAAARILVVEDEPINLKTMLLSLQFLGCTGVGADSAYKGLAMLRKEKFDVVIMDVQMPGLDGLEATRLIRGDTSGALDAKIPIVAITAHALQGDKERILKAGVDEYIAKPVYLEQLRSVLSKILNRPLELKHD